jgi:hypothetical protein
MVEMLGSGFDTDIISCVLSQLPFVQVKASHNRIIGDNEVSLNSLASICPSKDADGGAQCFLVIVKSEFSADKETQDMDFQTISELIGGLNHASKLKLLSSLDKKLNNSLI